MSENNTPDPVSEIERLRELGAQNLEKLREEHNTRRAELDRIDREAAAELAAHEREFAQVIAQKQFEAQLLHATERLAAAQKVAAEANTAADAAREGLGAEQRALVERFLEWRKRENTLAAAEDARQQAAEALAHVDGTATAPVPSGWSQGQPIYSTRQPAAPRFAQFIDWSSPITWLAWAAASSEPKKNPLNLGFMVKSR